MSFAVASPTPNPESGQAPIRVMVVDDAVVVRGLLARWIDAEAGLQIVGSMRSGREAIEQLERINPDVVILDVDMPDTDGITALPRLLEKKRDLVVIMASTLTRRNAEISLRALSLGAADYIPKPETTREITTSAAFRRELIDKIKALGSRRKRPLLPHATAAPRRSRIAAGREPEPRPGANPSSHQAAAVPADVAPRPAHRLLDRRSAGAQRPARPDQRRDRSGAGAAGAAHAAHLHDYSRRTPVRARAAGRPARRSKAKRCVPARSTSRRADATCGWRGKTAPRSSGSMTARWSISAGRQSIRCSPPPPRCGAARASRSFLPAWARTAPAALPTSSRAGSGVIAQDEELSVVWGMPGSVAQAGLCSAVLPLDQIAPRIVRLFAGDLS